MSVLGEIGALLKNDGWDERGFIADEDSGGKVVFWQEVYKQYPVIGKVKMRVNVYLTNTKEEKPYAHQTILAPDKT